MKIKLKESVSIMESLLQESFPLTLDTVAPDRGRNTWWDDRERDKLHASHESDKLSNDEARAKSLETFDIVWADTSNEWKGKPYRIGWQRGKHEWTDFYGEIKRSH